MHEFFLESELDQIFNWLKVYFFILYTVCICWKFDPLQVSQVSSL